MCIRDRLTEAHWDTQKASKVYPGQILEKDPVVKNIGENSANVFLEVNVPTVSYTHLKFLQDTGCTMHS